MFKREDILAILDKSYKRTLENDKVIAYKDSATHSSILAFKDKLIIDIRKARPNSGLSLINVSYPIAEAEIRYSNIKKFKVMPYKSIKVNEFTFTFNQVLRYSEF